MEIRDIDYRDGAVRLKGFLTSDDTLLGRRPGVLIVHEGLGPNDHAMNRARMVAQLGYVAFAADMFGERKQAKDLEESHALIGELRREPAKLLRRAVVALEMLASMPQVDSACIAAIGFCFGGATVLELARAGIDLKAVVSFHGVLATTIPAMAGKVKARVLVCTGTDDPLVPADQVAAFTEEMRAAAVADWQLISYQYVAWLHQSRRNRCHHGERALQSRR